MAKTRASRAAPKARRASATASDAKRKTAPAKAAKRKAAPAKAKAKPGGARPRSDGGQSARSRLVELKRRIREMASLHAGPEPGAARTCRQGEGEARGNCRSSGRQAVGQRDIGRVEAGGAEAAAAGGARHRLRRRRARLGPGDLHAEGRGLRAGAPGRHAQPAGTPAVHRSGGGEAARRPDGPCEEPARGLRRRLPDPGGAAPVRQGGQGAGRVRGAPRGGGIGLLRRLDAGAARQRLRGHAPVPGADARFQPRVRPLSRPLRSHRRPADRRPGRRHDGGQRPRPVRRPAGRAGAYRARHRRAAARGRQLPAPALSRGAAARVQRRRDPALRL